MRWHEITESYDADKARKLAQKRLKAHQKIGDAQRKKTAAAQRYQDQLRSANNAQQSAQTALQDLSEDQ